GWARSAATNCATMVITSSLPTLPMVVMARAAPGVVPWSPRGGAALRRPGPGWRGPRRNGNLGCGGSCGKGPQGAPGATPCGQAASAQQLEHALGGLVGLGQHRGAGLLQDLVARAVGQQPEQRGRRHRLAGP